MKARGKPSHNKDGNSSVFVTEAKQTNPLSSRREPEEERNETEGRKELSLILRIESKIPIIVGVIISA